VLRHQYSTMRNFPLFWHNGARNSLSARSTVQGSLTERQP